MRTVAILFALLVCWAGGLAEASGESPFEVALRQTLLDQAPDAVAPWDAGNAARERGRFLDAERAYQQVGERAPRFDAAFRRRAGALHQLGRMDEARAAAEIARELDDSPLNRSMLGEMIRAQGTPHEHDRALELLRSAAGQAPDQPQVVVAYCQVQFDDGELAAARSCIDDALASHPDDPSGNYLAMRIYAGQSAFAEARAFLARARPALDASDYVATALTLDELERAERAAAQEAHDDAALAGWAWAGAWLLTAWAGVMLLLFALGWTLSALTLRALSRAATADDAAGTASERRLRRVYGVVVALTGVYFYLSVPIVLAALLALGVGVFAAMLLVGFIPIKLLVITIVLVGGAVIAVVRGLLVRREEVDPGPRLDLDDHPALRALLAEVAAAVGTRPVDAVYLTPGSELAVFERGGPWRRRRMRGLILGVGMLDGLHTAGLRAILAHEYGHYRNDDTAGGRLALRVRLSLDEMIGRLAASGTAGLLNPAWWFVLAYRAVFLRVSQGASRLREVLADRWAAQAYGSDSFVAGFTHVVTRTVRFDHHTARTLREVIDQARPLANLYRYQPAPIPDDQDQPDLDAEIAAALAREAHPYDSHPAPQQRLRWVAALAAPGSRRDDDHHPAWSLFDDRDAIEHAMTAQVRDRIAARHGVHIAAQGDARP